MAHVQCPHCGTMGKAMNNLDGCKMNTVGDNVTDVCYGDWGVVVHFRH